MATTANVTSGKQLLVAGDIGPADGPRRIDHDVAGGIGTWLDRGEYYGPAGDIRQAAFARAGLWGGNGLPHRA